jgi:hypothetical protein
VHPELHRLFGLEIEQHAAPFGQFFAVHQAQRPFRRIGRELDGEGMHAGARNDLDRVRSGRARCRQRNEQGPPGNEQCGREP